MGIVAIKCPSCGGDVQLDDTKEFGFCINCGTKVMLQSAQKIKVSGKVKLDTSDNAANCMKLADQAFNSQNYAEAYNYYTKVLEYDSSSYKAVFRKGLCAGYVSDKGELRIDELANGYNNASTMINMLIAKGGSGVSSDELKAELKKMTEKFCEFALKYPDKYMRINAKQNFLSSSDAYKFAMGIVTSSALLSLVNKCIDSEYEDMKKKILSKNIDVCDKLLKNYQSMEYPKGISIDEKGRQTTEYAKFVVASQMIDNLESERKEAVENYRNLPSNYKVLKEFDDAIKKQQSLIDEYNKSVSDFWNANKDKYNGYKKINLQSFISVVIGIIASLVILHYRRPIGIGLLIAVVLINILINYLRIESYEDSNFSDEMRKKKAQNEKDVELLNNKKTELDRFESTLKS